MSSVEIQSSGLEVPRDPRTRSKIDSLLKQDIQLKTRIDDCLSNSDTSSKAKCDYIFILRMLGLEEHEAKCLWNRIKSLISQNKDLKAIELELFKEFRSFNLPEIWNIRLALRAQLIYKYIAPHLFDVDDSVIDYGTGDGRVANHLKSDLKLDIHGIDKCDYRTSGIDVPFQIIDGKDTKYPDNRFEAGVMTNIAHHDPDHDGILKEINRIVRRKLVVMETVPEGETPEEIEQDKDRIFMNDYLYNRLLPNTDIQIPGAYRTPEQWKEFFQKHGWTCTHEDELLGFATVMRDAHHLFVFER